jgi:S1-C subfamily serine protease
MAAQAPGSALPPPPQPFQASQPSGSALPPPPPLPPGYGQPQYGQPEYGQPQYGQAQYGQAQYGQAQYGQAQYGAYGQPQHAAAPASTRRGHQLEMSKGRRRIIAGLAVLGLLAVPAVVGYDLGQRNSGSSSSASSFTVPNSVGSQSGTSSNPTGGSSTGSANGTIDATAIADKVDDSIVNLTSTLSTGGEAAGTGIIISSNGLVLTNNHVIANATSLQAENAASGATWSAKVLGYDIQDDVALVQLQDASGLKAASLGEASSLSVGDPIVAIGNAGGKGGSPTVVTGSVTALDQQITAADEDGSNAETLDNLVQINADIQPGDSGGALVNGNGAVVGMNAAASTGNGGGGFGFGQSSGNEGYAIPIENAVAIAKKIASGQGGDRIHIGGNRALLGVAVAASTSQGGFGQSNGQSNGSSDGAVVNSVQSGSAAEQAGIQAGDVITGVDNVTVSSAQDLTHALTTYQPKDTVTITWTDSSGQSHHADVQLGSGAPA